MTTAPDIVRIVPDRIGIDDLLHELGAAVGIDDPPGDDGAVGALVVFSGIVRAAEGDRTISHLQYDHYPAMAERESQRLVERARERWTLRRVGMIHRYGQVPVGEASVVVAVLAGHRPEAFEAARFLIDELKKSVPIWKRADEQARD